MVGEVKSRFRNGNRETLPIHSRDLFAHSLAFNARLHFAFPLGLHGAHQPRDFPFVLEQKGEATCSIIDDFCSSLDSGL